MNRISVHYLFVLCPVSPARSGRRRRRGCREGDCTHAALFEAFARCYLSKFIKRTFICRLSGSSFVHHGNMRANQRDRARNGAHSKEQSHRAPHGRSQGTSCQAQNGVVDTESIVIIPVAVFPLLFLFQLPLSPPFSPGQRAARAAGPNAHHLAIHGQHPGRALDGADGARGGRGGGRGKRAEAVGR